MGHRRGIACLQYHDRLVVSGSSDNSIRYLLYFVFCLFYAQLSPVYFNFLIFFILNFFVCWDIRILL